MKKSTKIIILALLAISIAFACETIKTINDMKELTQLVNGK